MTSLSIAKKIKLKSLMNVSVITVLFITFVLITTDITYDNTRLLSSPTSTIDSDSPFIVDSAIATTTNLTKHKQDESIISVIKVGEGPSKLVFNPANNMMYVLNSFSGTISVIEDTTLSAHHDPLAFEIIPQYRVVDTINVGGSPDEMAFNPANNYIYVTNRDLHTVYVIDSFNNSVVDTIKIDYPNKIVFNPANNNMYVFNEDKNRSSHYMTIINSNNTVIDTIDVDFYMPTSLAFNPENKNLYVVEFDSTDLYTVYVIDSFSNSVVDTLEVGEFPGEIMFNPVNNNMYVIDGVTDTMYVINSNNSVVDTVETGRHPRELVFSPSNNNTYVTNIFDNSISVIDASSNVIDTIHLDGTPGDPTYNPANNTIYVSTVDPRDPQKSEYVSIIDSNNTVIDTIKVGSPRGMAFNPSDNNMYVASVGNDDTVYILNSFNIKGD